MFAYIARYRVRKATAHRIVIRVTRLKRAGNGACRSACHRIMSRSSRNVATSVRRYKTLSFLTIAP